MNYQDTGCAAAPRCLSCCLPICLEDLAERRHGRAYARDAAIVTLHQQGISATRLARQFGMRRRSVHRAIARARQET